MKSILDSAFRYTPSASTDLKKTFARLRREERARDLARTKARLTEHAPATVTHLPLKGER